MRNMVASDLHTIQCEYDDGGEGGKVTTESKLITKHWHRFQPRLIIPGSNN